MMTSAQLHAARMLIPGEFEPNASPHRATRPAPWRRPPPAPFREAGQLPIVDSYVVAAAARPTTRLGFAAGILGDVALCMAFIYGVALVPGLAVQGIKAAAALMLDTFGGH
jgi:hypothetical protein